MKKTIYDSSNGLWYELQGDYYLPRLIIPEDEVHTIGIHATKITLTENVGVIFCPL